MCDDKTYILTLRLNEKTTEAFQQSVIVFLSSAHYLKQLEIKQECIPVGCVPPARYRMGGLCPGGVFLTETPLDRDPQTETPPDVEAPSTETPGTETTPWTETEPSPPPRWTDRHL